MPIWAWIVSIGAGCLFLLFCYDVTQRRRAIVHNFPIIGHLRYILEAVGPELRQYIVTNNDEERPFSRDERRWVYASSKKENPYFGFGTDNDLEQTPNYLIIRHAAFPLNAKIDALASIPCAKVLGEARGRAKAFRPSSIVNMSAMSYGSLSGPAIEALNRGVALANALHNTGEGGISDFHRKGGELIWQIGTGYFGCRNQDGSFSMDRCLESVASAKVKAIEIKLSQGAKPGMGGMLPAAKVTPEIARIRGVPIGKAVYSPPGHTAFTDVNSMLDFIETLAQATGLPVGIKSAVGQMSFWHDLAAAMRTRKCGPDFITIDGGEGGTGAAPLVFSDHVALPWKLGFSSVYRIFAEAGLQDEIVFVGSGKLGLPQSALLAMSMGADLIHVAREGLLAIGCIQAQKCHTGHCPAGIATQNRWLMRGLDPTLKSARLANYFVSLRTDLLHLSHACGHLHPSLVSLDQFEVLDGLTHRNAMEAFEYDPSWEKTGAQQVAALEQMMRDFGASAGVSH